MQLKSLHETLLQQHKIEKEPWRNSFEGEASSLHGFATRLSMAGCTRETP